MCLSLQKLLLLLLKIDRLIGWYGLEAKSTRRLLTQRLSTILILLHKILPEHKTINLLLFFKLLILITCGRILVQLRSRRHNRSLSRLLTLTERFGGLLLLLE